MIDPFQTRVSTELNRFVRKVTACGVDWHRLDGDRRSVRDELLLYMPELGWRWGYPAMCLF